MKPARFIISILSFSILLVPALKAQSQAIVIPANINIAQDSVAKRLITTLDSLLADKEKTNKENAHILKEDLLETSALLDEMKGIEQNAPLKDAHFYKPYLTNLIKHGANYIVQFSYKGIANSVPVTAASFRLMAKQVDGRFYFSSPLKQNTRSWKMKKAGYITFYYKKKLDAADVAAFRKAVEDYDKKLKANTPIIQYYCDNFAEAQQLMGIDYKADYAGVATNNLTANENGTSLIINGWNSEQNRFDPHDLFHDRLRTVMSPDVINRPVDEGAAYLYGGSWGKSKEAVMRMFKAYAAANPNADWVKEYIDAKNYDNDNGKTLKVPFAINALIIQKIEKEKGFNALMELLSCGKKEKGDENYFKALAKLTGITKATFNAEVWKLIKGV